MPLSDEGRNEVVRVLADHLKSIPIVCVYCGTLKRKVETAHIIKTGLPSEPKVIQAPEINTWDLPFTAGGPKALNKPVVKYLISHPRIKPPAGESYGDFSLRFDTYMKKQMKDIESGKEEGPILDVLSGSNCRRLSELLFRDRDILDVDEAGLFMLYPAGDGKWSGMVVCGGAEEHGESS